MRIANDSAPRTRARGERRRRVSQGAGRPGLAGFARHVAACNNAALPGGRHPLRLVGATIGWIDPSLAPALAALGAAHGLARSVDGGFDIADAAVLEPLAAALAAAGHFRHRGEAFDILSGRRGRSVGRIDRGALPGFGLVAAGVHLNGLVRHPRGAEDGPHLWVGRRADDKLLDPGKLDHLVAGGIPAGYGPERTLVKEGEEECRRPPAWGGRAVKVAEISYDMQRPEGLRRDLLHCYDLWLPPDWVPVPNDGEVAEFRLLPLDAVLRLVRDTDRFKFNVNLVLIDLLLRLGLLDEASEAGGALRAGLRGPP